MAEHACIKDAVTSARLELGLAQGALRGALLPGGQLGRRLLQHGTVQLGHVLRVAQRVLYAAVEVLRKGSWEKA